MVLAAALVSVASNVGDWSTDVGNSQSCPRQGYPYICRTHSTYSEYTGLDVLLLGIKVRKFRAFDRNVVLDFQLIGHGRE